MNDEYKPCVPCSKKVGAYVLCEPCLHNRNTIARLETERNDYMVKFSRAEATIKSILDYLWAK